MNIFKCIKCNRYTLKEICPYCNSSTISPKPPKFSPHDNYGRYRRMMKKVMEERGKTEKNAD